MDMQTLDRLVDFHMRCYDALPETALEPYEKFLTALIDGLSSESPTEETTLMVSSLVEMRDEVSELLLQLKEADNAKD